MNLDLLKLYALQFVGINYKWGGDEPMSGYDCSGFAQELLAAAGIDPPGDQTAQNLYYAFFNCPKKTELGALAFYGRDENRISHVAFCLDSETCIEAGGGGSRTVDRKSAAKHNAFIRLRPISRRSDLVSVLLPNYDI